MRSASWESWMASPGYGARIMIMAALAATLPLVIVLSAPPVAGLAPTLAVIVAFLSLIALSRALRPLAAAEDILAASVSQARGEVHVAGLPHLLTDAMAVTAKLDAMSQKAKRHPLTELPRRDEFAANVAADISADGARVIGVVRFANHAQIAAFDSALADRMLLGFARRLEGAVDKSRFVAHVDRDCFAICFRGVGQKAAAGELQAISYVLAQELSVEGTSIAPDVQIGSALYPVDGDDPATLLTRAFVSLARPQRTVTGAVAFFAGRPSADAQRRFFLEQALRQAVRENQLALHYQPLVDISKGQVVGAEALMRWRHPELGLVKPSEFVPILEDSGLVSEIGVWALNTACRQARTWEDAGLKLKVAVNLSAHQLRDPSLKTVLEGTLKRHMLEASSLELELTETAAMEDAERTLELFRQLHAQGFGLSIDDFGAGYSSLGYLKRLPFNKLKIDREFVTHIDSRSDSRAICKALIELADGLGISILAEGVERREEVEELRRLGCSVFQGFYFAPALPAEEFSETVRRPDWLAFVSSPARREQAEIERRIAQ